MPLPTANHPAHLLFRPENRLHRAHIITKLQHATLPPEFAMPEEMACVLSRYSSGEIPFHEATTELEKLYGLTPEEQSERESAVLQSLANIWLSGLDVDPEILLLHERYIAGNINLAEKLSLIKQRYQSQS